MTQFSKGDVIVTFLQGPIVQYNLTLFFPHGGLTAQPVVRVKILFTLFSTSFYPPFFFFFF